ncbi:MAG: hypothetical protein LIP00_00860 [Parabacteroides sp.]|nr:hypothetical protein [Parabacteroides sp.]
MKETLSSLSKARTFRTQQAHTPTSSRQQFPFADNRPIARFQQAVQRKVLIDKQPAIPTLHGEAFIQGQAPVKMPPDKTTWLTDEYARWYNNTGEFENHITGKPVDCGLAKKYGEWYRIKHFSEHRFFVLGENHAAFGYRELMQESNQPGKILGEGGSNQLMSAHPASKLEANPASSALQDTTGKQSREYVMENPVSKAYFALPVLKSCIKNKDKLPGIGTGPDDKKIDAATWIKNYQSAHPADRGRHDTFHVPYYKEGGKFVYAEYKTKAENYALTSTAKSILDTLFTQLDKKTIRTDYEPEAWVHLSYFHKKTTMDWKVSDDLHYYPLLQALKEGSEKEAELWKETPDQPLPAGLEAAAATPIEQPAQADIPKLSAGKKAALDKAHKAKAYAHREYSMYQSILKAQKDASFVMAGMGNNHAQHLKGALEAVPIPVITVEDFHNDYTQDAITPMTEQDKDFGAKETDAGEAYQAYIEELARIQEAEALKTKKPEEIATVQVKVTKKLSGLLFVFGIVLAVGAIVTLGYLSGLGEKLFPGTPGAPGNGTSGS